MLVIVAVDNEFSADDRKRALERHCVGKALVACRRQRRMMNHYNAERVLFSQIVECLRDTRELRLAHLSGSNERRGRDRGRDADQRHRSAPTHVWKFNLVRSSW